MFHHQGVSLSEQHTVDIIFDHGTQTMQSNRVCHNLLLHKHGEQVFTRGKMITHTGNIVIAQSGRLLWLHRLDYELNFCCVQVLFVRGPYLSDLNYCS